MMIFFSPCFDPVGEYIYIFIYNDMFRYLLNCTFPSKNHAWTLEVPRNSRGASQPASLASNMGSGICRDFTRVPSRLRFTCQVWLRWKPHKNIWWLSKKTQGKETKNGWKDSKMDKKAHASVKTSPSSSNSTISKLLQQYYISFFQPFSMEFPMESFKDDLGDWNQLRALPCSKARLLARVRPSSALVSSAARGSWGIPHLSRDKDLCTPTIRTYVWAPKLDLAVVFSDGILFWIFP